MKRTTISAEFAAKLEAFRRTVEEHQLQQLVISRIDCECNRDNSRVSVVIVPKYTKVDIGNSGRYMVVNETGEIFGIKAYGVIHRGHAYGTLDTIHDWYWGGYVAGLSDIAKAKRLGAAAFYADRSSVPAEDPNLMPLLVGKAPGQGIEILDAWMTGWHAANVLRGAK